MAEEQLASAVEDGVRQHVVLGAGLDTFICRNPHRDLRVFEVDFPPQAWKRQLLRDTGLTMPDTAAFVRAEFTRQSVVDALDQAGFDRRHPFFSCSA